MNAQHAIQIKLNEKLTAAKLRNPSLSLRAFARRLGVSPATLSMLLNGRRRISPALANEVLERAGLSPVEIQEVLMLFPKKRQAPPSGTEQAVHQLTMDQHQIVSEWQHFAVRALLRTPEAQASREGSTPAWIARRLGIKSSQVEVSIERLLRLEMIERKEDGGLRATDAMFQSPDGSVSAALRHNHAQHLELARASLDQDSLEIRDFTNLIMTVSRKDLPLAKQAIRRFRQEFDALMTDNAPNPPDEVYCFAVQFFPLSKVNE